MAADIDPVALVDMRARDAADPVGGLEDQRRDIGAAQQFQRGGEAGRPAAGDDGDLASGGVSRWAHLNSSAFLRRKLEVKLAAAAATLPSV